MITCCFSKKVTAIFSAVMQFSMHALRCSLLLMDSFKNMQALHACACTSLSIGFLITLWHFCASCHCNTEVLHTKGLTYFHSFLCGQGFMVFLFFLVCLRLREWIYISRTGNCQRFDVSEHSAVAVSFHIQCFLVTTASANQTPWG